jgi:hypothetical protein
MRWSLNHPPRAPPPRPRRSSPCPSGSVTSSPVAPRPAWPPNRCDILNHHAYPRADANGSLPPSARVSASARPNRGFDRIGRSTRGPSAVLSSRLYEGFMSALCCAGVAVKCWPLAVVALTADCERRGRAGGDAGDGAGGVRRVHQLDRPGPARPLYRERRTVGRGRAAGA